MTTETVKGGPLVESDIDDLGLEPLLLDSEWVDSEFAAIMIASGFGDRIIAGTDPRPVVATRPTAPACRRGHREVDRRHASSRVRSPPSRR
jgi:hypothetical protein